MDVSNLKPISIGGIVKGNTEPKPLPKLKPLTKGLSGPNLSGYGTPVLDKASGEYKSPYNVTFIPAGGVDVLNSTRANNQRWYQYLGKGITTLGARFTGEIAKMPVSIGVAVGESIDQVLGTTLTKGEDYASSFDQSGWLNYIDSFSDAVADAVPLYERDINKSGGFVRTTLLNPYFYATQGADGIGFAASFLTPTLAIKALKLGVGASKLMYRGIAAVSSSKKQGIFKAANVIGANGRNLDLALATSFNTYFESASESREAMKELRTALQDSGLTKKEIEEKIATVGKNVFTSNLAILTGPNLLLNKVLLGGLKFGKIKRLSTSGKGLESVIKHQRLSGGKMWANVARDLSLGIFSEGFVEEVSQSTVSKFYQDQAEKGTNKNILPNFISEYTKMLGTTEGQQAAYLGALLGGVMGGGMAYQNIKNTNKAVDGFINNMNNNFSAFSSNLAAPYLTVDGEIQFDPISGNPIPSEAKVKGAIEAKFSIENIASILEYAKGGKIGPKGEYVAPNPILYEMSFNRMFTDLVTPYTMVEGGTEILNQQLSGIFDVLVASDPKGENRQGEEAVINKDNTTKYVSELISKAKEVQSIADVYTNFIADTVASLDKGELNEEGFNIFKHQMAVNFIQAVSAKEAAQKAIKKDKGNLNSFREKTETTEEDKIEFGGLQTRALKSWEEAATEKVKEFSTKEGLKDQLKTFTETHNSYIKEVDKRKKESDTNTEEGKRAAKQKEVQSKNTQEGVEERNPPDPISEENIKTDISNPLAYMEEPVSSETIAPKEFYVEDEEFAPFKIKGKRTPITEVADLHDALDFADDTEEAVEDYDIYPPNALDLTGGEEYLASISASESNEKYNKIAEKDTEQIEKNNNVTQLIGQKDIIAPLFPNITEAYIDWLRTFEIKEGLEVTFKIDHERHDQYIQGPKDDVDAILSKIKKGDKITEKERKTLIDYLPINAVFVREGVDIPIGQPHIKKDRKLKVAIVDELIAGNSIENISSIVKFQTPGKLNTIKELKTNIKDLEYIKGDIDKISLYKVDRKGNLIDSNGAKIGINRGTIKAGSVYLRSELYNGDEIFISLDTRKVNEKESDIIARLFREVLSNTVKIGDIESILKADIIKSLGTELEVLGRASVDEIQILDLINFLMYTGTTPAKNNSNLVQYRPKSNVLLVGNRKYSKLNDKNLNEVYEFFLKNKFRKVSFVKTEKNVNNLSYKEHIIDNILTTTIVGKNKDNIQQPMFKGNVNVYISNTPTIKKPKSDPKIREAVEAPLAQDIKIKETASQGFVSRINFKEKSKKELEKILSKSGENAIVIANNSKNITKEKCD